ncbi:MULTISPECIES: YdcF family protein [unclassified Nostoc]|uniref:YdcF family protein n=1 Tax=unclassified Nostoc TaxID=2593658 RepID=UPI002AD5A4A4|nr:YdcF family protein [Nostoc sp. DedQUE03]MDZ7973502.1 YdcF family protein [Nostoc sp. DedQUE03]MDZ8047259.1 YdcF family protein [Nostoc sp. DedQUE02]
MNRFHRQLKKYWIFFLTGLILILLAIIPLDIAIALYQAPQPQAILTLGGWTDREQTAAEIARWYPSLEVWVSSGTPPKLVRPIFQAAGISQNRLHLDYRAVDTVTNFTTVVPELKGKHIHHIYLITSDYHMPRAKAIATLILGSQGIAFTPISVPSDQSKKETISPIIRDLGRSLLWIVTGHTGTSFQAAIDLP